MGKNWDEKSSNEILIDIKQMEHEYEALKSKMLTDWDKLMEIEKNYKEAHLIITSRLKSK